MDPTTPTADVKNVVMKELETVSFEHLEVFLYLLNETNGNDAPIVRVLQQLGNLSIFNNFLTFIK